MPAPNTAHPGEGNNKEGEIAVKVITILALVFAALATIAAFIFISFLCILNNAFLFVKKNIKNLNGTLDLYHFFR